MKAKISGKVRHNRQFDQELKLPSLDITQWITLSLTKPTGRMENEENTSPPTSSPSPSNQVILAKSDVREETMEGVSRETQMSIAVSSTFPGFRFSPTDVELISYYLQKKLDGYDKCVEIISEIDICRFEPWDLPAKSVIQSDNDWFFFSARGRKYPNGSQSKRTTELGYWKATGKERNVKSGSLVIGTKRILVFHIGRAPKGERTEWIMHEYCMNGKPQDSMVVCRLHRNNKFRLTDNSNNASPSQGHVSASHNSDLTLVDGAIDQTGVIDVDKAGESCPKKCSSSSSYEPHLLEQLDSASESERKLSREGTLAESSSCQKDSDDEDFYADILKDDIVKLDEISLSAIPRLDHPVVSTTKPEAERISQQPAQATSSQTQTPQGTANRRIKLRKNKLRSARSHDLEKIPSGGKCSPGKIKDLNYGKMPKSLLRVLSAKAVKHRFVSLLFITMSLLVLLLPLWGG